MDEEFERMIHKIKPLAKSLPRNTDERHHVTMWIKKLLSEKADKASRNHHTQLLLKLLQKNQLQSPFTSNPPPGNLPQNDELDSLLLMSPISSISPGHITSNSRLPKHSTPLKPIHQTKSFRKHIVQLESSDSDSSFDEKTKLPITSHQKTCRKSNFISLNDSSDDDEEHNNFKSKLTTKSSPRLMRKSRKSFEISFADNETIKSFLDQKNNEIESLRKEYAQKSYEMETKYQEMESNVVQLEQELIAKKEEHIDELAKVKESFQRQLQQSKGNLKRKFQGIVTNIEREKIQFENQQSQDMQALLDDANSKLLQVNTEVQTLTQTVNTLESQNQSLNKQLDITHQAKETYLRDKSQLQEQCFGLENNLKLANKKIKTLEKQYAHLKEEKEGEISALKIEAEKNIQSLKNEIELEKSKLLNEASSFKEEIQKLENVLKEVKSGHRQKVMELESSAWKQVHEKETEINTLRNTLEKKDFESKELLSTLKKNLHEAENKIKELKATCEYLKKEIEKAAADGKSSLQKAENEHQSTVQKMQAIRLEEKEQKYAIIKSLEQNISELTSKLEEQTMAAEVKYQEKYIQEKSLLTGKHAIQVQHLQHDHELNMALAEEQISSLKFQVKTLEEDHERTVSLHNEEMKKIEKEKDDELNKFKIQCKEMESIHAQVLANEKATSDELEKRLQDLQQTYESQLSELKVSMEQRQVVLTKQEYEEAIHALKQEVHILTQRADVLQKQLAQFRTCSTLRKHIKSTAHKKH